MSKKLSELSKIHGKDETNKISAMEKLLNNQGKSKYSTLDVLVYENQLNSMDWNDLRRHSLEIGILAGDIENKSRLKHNLLISFREFNAQFSTKEIVASKPDRNNKKSKKIMDAYLKRSLG